MSGREPPALPPEFYVDLVKAAFSRTAAAGLSAEAVEEHGHPRLAKRVEAVLEGWGFTGFDHLRPALELSRRPDEFPLPDDVLDRAEALFSAINACLEAEEESKPRTTRKKAATNRK